MKYIFFFLPFQYFYTTRIKSLSAFINWFFIYVVPTFSLFHFMVNNGSPIQKYLGYIAIVLSVYSIYEAGYIQNDTETIKLESNPTLRLSENALKYYAKHKNAIYATRISLALFWGGVASVLNHSSTKQIFLTFLFLSMIGVVFYIYNQIRNHFTLLLLWVLVSLRYAAPLMPVYTQETYFYLFLIVLIYPVLNLFEWTYRSRFQKYALPFQRVTLRIGYYFVLSVVFGYLFLFTSDEQYEIGLLLSIYFLLYRTFFSFVYKRKEQ